MQEYQTTLQTNFASGELSPELQGFVNLKDYINGLLKQENFINDNNGGVFFRPGTYYAANTAGNAQAKLVPFVFNKLQAYTLEFTPQRLRFYTNNGQLQVSFATTAGSWSGGTATLTIGTHPFLLGDTITVAGVSPSGYNGTFTITSITATQVKYTVANPGAYVSAGTVQGAYQIVTPFATGPTSWAQVEDVMYLVDGKNPIQQLVRTGATTWTMTAANIISGPYNPINTSAATLTLSGGGSLTVTCSNPIFASTDVGREILYLDSSTSYQGSAGQWLRGQIATYVSTTQVTVTDWRRSLATRLSGAVTPSAGITITAATWAGNQVTFTTNTNELVSGMQILVSGVTPSAYNGTYTIKTRSATSIVCNLTSNPGAYVSGGVMNSTPQTSWALGAWSQTTGYPTCLTFHEQRLVAGGATSDSSLTATTFFGSVAGYFTSFSQFDPDGTVNPDNGYSFQIASGRADGIKWLLSDRALLIGTGAGEYIATSSGPSITPTDVDVKMQTSLGNSGVTPAQLNYRLIIAQRGNLYLHQWVYNWQVGGYIGQLINKESDQILQPGITRLDFQLNPTPRIISVRSDGQLVIATDNGEDWAFGRYVLGGSFGGGQAVVEDMCVIPTATYDQIWLSVKRTVNGQTVRHVEFVTGPFDGVMADAFFVDCGQQYNGAPTTTLSGFGYLQGQTVAVLGDGVYQGDQVVPSNGILTVASASKFSVGLKYTGTCETLQLSNQEIQGRSQYAIRAYLRLYQTYGGSVLSGATYTTPRAISESASSLYTGSIRMPLDHGSDTEQHIFWTQTSPYPMAVLNASIDFTVGQS